MLVIQVTNFPISECNGLYRPEKRQKMLFSQRCYSMFNIINFIAYMV